MTLNGWIQVAIFCAIVIALAKPLGGFMTRVFTGERSWMTPFLRPVERGIYRIAGIDERQDQHWTAYAASMLLFSGLGFLLLYLLQRTQHLLPLNTQGLSGVPADLAFNTAISFVTNTNWQSYVPEVTMSYL